MPVYIHPANLIISKQAIKQNYQGGIAQFRQDFAYENISFQEDAELFSLARLNCDEFPEDELVERGLHYDRNTGTSHDYVIISRLSGPLWNVEWLETSSVYAHHKQCSMENKARVVQMEQMPVDEVQRIFENGGNPFEVIW